MRPFLALALFAAAACRAPAAPSSEVWLHLAARYDVDGDGRLSPAECGREGEEFARLDADGDGVLTPADFPHGDFERDLSISTIPEAQRAQLRAMYDARAVVLAYFPKDADAEGLSREALKAAFEGLDLDFDGALAAAEFAQATDRLPWGGPGEAWPLLLAAIDGPGEGQGELALGELEAYHGRLGGDDGLMRPPPGGESHADAAFASDGPPVGSLAPDFALSPPEGGASVRLSERRGRPVALIFGSWT
jgi:hypothetical protein